MKEIIPYIPMLLPIILIHLILAAVALIQILKHGNYRGSNRWIWCAVVLFIQIVGPIIYFLAGRDDTK